MNLYKQYIQFNASKLIAFLLVALTIIITCWYFTINDAQYSSLVSGLATGFVFATIQFFFSWYEYVKIDRYDRMKIKDIRPDRDKRELYESLINTSKKRIVILAVTANRLINDFADEASGQDHKKVLLTALSRGVSIRILLPDILFLDASQQPHFDNIKTRLQQIATKYTNFEYKYFQHPPYHSIFLVDDECIIGPVFPNVSSKNTPSIYVDSSSPFATTYLEYFEDEWQ
jgi:hypothetical protein